MLLFYSLDLVAAKYYLIKADKLYIGTKQEHCTIGQGIEVTDIFN